MVFHISNLLHTRRMGLLKAAGMKIACIVWMAIAAIPGTLHAQQSWQCSTPHNKDAVLLRGPVLLGVGTGHAFKEARAATPLSHLLNNGRPVIAEIEAHTAAKLKLSWTVDNTGQAPDLQVSRIFYTAQLDKRTGAFSLDVSARGYDGLMQTQGTCVQRASGQ